MTTRRSFLESGCLAANHSHDNKTEVIKRVYQEGLKVNPRKAVILANVKYLLVILVSKQNNLLSVNLGITENNSNTLMEAIIDLPLQ